MVTASVVQTAIFLMTAVKMFTVFQVIRSYGCCVCHTSMKSHFADPRKCEDVGITECCSDLSGFGSCEVHYPDYSVRCCCSCNVSCHQRYDCCLDAVAICCLRKFSRYTVTVFGRCNSNRKFKCN